MGQHCHTNSGNGSTWDHSRLMKMRGEEDAKRVWFLCQLLRVCAENYLSAQLSNSRMSNRLVFRNKNNKQLLPPYIMNNQEYVISPVIYTINPF